MFAEARRTRTLLTTTEPLIPGHVLNHCLIIFCSISIDKKKFQLHWNLSYNAKTRTKLELFTLMDQLFHQINEWLCMFFSATEMVSVQSFYFSSPSLPHATLQRILVIHYHLGQEIFQNSSFQWNRYSELHFMLNLEGR